MLAAMVDEASVGIAGFGQLRAAIRMYGGDRPAAEGILEDTLARLRDEREIADLSFQIGICAIAAGDPAAARRALDRAAALRPERAVTLRTRARLIWQSEGPEAGRAAFRDAIDKGDDPTFWSAWATLEAETDRARAQSLFEEALARHPDSAALKLDLAWSRLHASEFEGALAALGDGLPGVAPGEEATLRGLALYGLRRVPEARAALAAAREAAPLIAEAEVIYGYAAWFCGDADAAEAVFRGLLAEDPANPAGIGGLAALRLDAGRDAEAEALLAGCPAARRSGVYMKLTDLASYRERPLEAIEWLRRADEDDPGNGAIHARWAGVLYGIGRPDLAVPHYDAATAASEPRGAINASNAVFLRHYDPELSPEDVAEAHRAYGERFGGEGEDPAWRFENVPDPDRRLRVAYISPDLRAHSVAYFMVSLIDRHDRDNFHLTVYYTSGARDAATEWFARTVDVWRDVEHVTDETLRRMIRDDRIDILVDLSGHTAHHRLGVFARRAAPVQVTYLGYPDTTGLPAMDYRIVDAVTDPPGEANLFVSEQLVRLPRTFLCYSTAEDIPDIAPSPATLGRPFTFGCFNNGLKLNARVYDAWVAILRAVPEARMLFKSVRFKNAHGGDLVLDEMTARGIAPERLVGLPITRTLGEHLATYAEVDLCLDPFPYNGTTTTCEAFSMGVPTLTLKGDRHSARVGESLVGAMGLSDGFVAADVDDYVRRAVDWAARRDDLAAMRPGMRDRFKASPLGDERGHARAMEAAYRAMWRVWCAAGPRHGLGPSRFDRELQACAKT